MISRYYVESLVPSWLASDPGYLAALGGHLADRMRAQGYEIVSGPAIGEAHDLMVPAPVGTVILRASIAVEEFDVDMGSEIPDGPS